MAKVTDDQDFVPLKPWGEMTHYLLGWYDTVQGNRDMPWRLTRDPYAIWLSETMLQQTQVDTVKPYFRRFLERFPTVSALAEADLDTVLALWAGLGYYRRARHLHAAAKAMVDHHGGQVPGTVEALMELPGVGRYTAGAVASIAFGVPAPVVDGNVMRVVARIAGFDRNIADPKNAGFFWKAAGEIVREGGGTETRRHERHEDHEGEETGENRPASVNVLNGGNVAGQGGRFGDVNQALMELGATVCVPPPGRPACLLCPVNSFCRAFAEGRQMDLPVKAKKKAVPEVEGMAVVLVRGPRGRSGERRSAEVLVMKRPAGVTWEGMWEFPVLEARKAKGERGERTGLAAAIAKALGITVKNVEECGEVVHTLTHRRMTFRLVRCEVEGDVGGVMLPECREGGHYVEARWVTWPLAKRGEMAFGRVVEKIAAAVQARAVDSQRAR